MLWGLSGPVFLLDYLAGVAGALAVALSVRTLVGWRTRGEPLSTVELAYLTDRAVLACQVGLAALRRAGVVQLGELATLSVDAPPPPRSAPLVRALHAALRRPQTWAAVLADPGVGRVLRRLVGRLVRDGWLLTPAQRRSMALGTLPLFAVAVVGLTRLVDSAVEGRDAGGPASVVGLLLCCLATVLGGWWLCEVPETGSAARRLLRRQRRTHAELAPQRRPAWSERGTDELLPAMAVFGPRPLLAVDPRFAELVGVDPEHTRPREYAKTAR
ncbi:TIGR04222 domain-containing membrane protein [Micromonospora narathiwatensis]|uniref:TIGR04222 domain-containing protein n=1 Tax=Micromonospora narathiwatensis TaxID=299146 RepID=A0A1A8ZMW2_9ACTN|nr:TIGR04222 domain-containing membrane protein [Micromonospora narathiwatensis]SBT45433.1 TIGR04222 domain-containing protein [Micromonospora narathiwatensis]